MTHQICTPSLLRLGSGAIKELPEVLIYFKLSAPLIVIDPFFVFNPQVRQVLANLEASDIRYAIFDGVVPDPTSGSVDDGVVEALRLQADSIVALGGGSAIDTAKAIALLSRHPVKLRDVRAPVRITARGLPLIAIPTTAGTGSEATRFCLVTDSESGDKMVCIGEGLMPAAAIVDYELTLSAPARLSADTGLDAFTHALEACVGRKANAYALSRPPGHHAFRDAASGFCFLNNAGIAAQYLRRSVSRVAVLDIDLHHGNGTQALFYDRSDILTVSLHADPEEHYPFFLGYADERGDGAGTGYNFNIPLPQGTTLKAYIEALRSSLNRILFFAPDVLVIALGLDISEKDPLARFAISTSGFAKIAEAIGKLHIPTVIVQEGGYVSDVLASNLRAFLDAYANSVGPRQA